MRTIGLDAIEFEDPRERMVMDTQSERNPESDPTKVEGHIRSAQQILKALQQKIGEHPEIGAAITKLEMALNDLAIQTGGLL
jgi:hypothetical protein